MAEEHGFQASEGHRLCANNCGFFGSPATQNYCSKCYHELFKDPNSKSLDSLFTLTSPSSSSPAAVSSSSAKAIESPVVDTRRTAVAEASVVIQFQPQTTSAVAQPNRCASCRKKVGLTGFRCRCGTTFCGIHRYPEQHGCSFDFKSMGREAIAKANPLIKGEKLNRI